jgi:ribosome-binding factor A
VGLVTVTGVDVTPDLRQARAWISIMGTEEERAATLEGLASLAGHLRSEIGRSLRLRNAPEITFRLDETVARAARIESLLAQVRDEGQARTGGGEEGAPGASENRNPDPAADANDVGTGEVRDDERSA